MKFRILDNGTMLEEFKSCGKTSALVVGNHIEPKGVIPRDDEYVIVLHNNRNKIPPKLINMAASYLWLSGDLYPSRAYFFPRQYPDHFESLEVLGRDVVYLMDPISFNSAFKVLGFFNPWYHPGPTTGFLCLHALEKAQVPTRVAGFSWYMDAGETYAVANHNPMEELKYVREVLTRNNLFSFTKETLSYLRLSGRQDE